TVAHFPAALRPALTTDVTNAFMSGLHHGCLIAGVVAVAAALLVLRRMPSQITSAGQQSVVIQDALR
ncbi:MAG TPA: hypothetical protein VG246_10345, partial [Acidimicrobiales bacterium]|nr:hypothetical protein [Acidimicrobiales bacterium]